MRRANGFTLLELLIVLTVIGILSSLALPRFLDIHETAKISACKGSLAGIRASLMLQYTEARLLGNPRWPSLVQIQDNEDNMGSGIMLDGNMPDNPFSTGSDRDLVVAVKGKPSPIGTEGAWAYDPRTGHFWANTDSGNSEVDF